MANLRTNDHQMRPIETACCRCSKSDLKMKKSGAPYLENALTKIEERRDDLANRQSHLKEKITAMERSIPALMAFNMWKSEGNCEDAPLCKLRQIMNKVSSRPDPTEKLVDNLKSTVKSLNTETAELHEKIIVADIKLEESEMELESLELANREFEDRLKSLEKELSRKRTPSLHSIHSEDLFCLSRIRNLGEEEVNLKHNIRELEERETLFQEQINRILTSREFQKAMKDSQCTGRKVIPCPVLAEKDNKQQIKKTLARTEKEVPTITQDEPHELDDSVAELDSSVDILDPEDLEQQKIECDTKPSKQSNRKENGGTEESLKACGCPTSALITCYDKSSCLAASRISTSQKYHSSRKSRLLQNERTIKCPKHQKSVSLSGCTPKTCCSSVTTKSHVSRRQCVSRCKNSTNSSPVKFGNHSTNVQSRSCKNKSSHAVPEIAKFPASTCKKCQGLILPQRELEPRQSRCSCSCKGKCAKGKSDVPCNCAEYLESSDDLGYQPSVNPARINDHSSTDEEYSECCDCGCNDSDDSNSCQC